MLILRMAFRNIFRQRRRTILTGLSMVVGFFLSALFIGWSDGSYNDIIDAFTRNRMGHIQIHEKSYLDRPSLYKTVEDVSTITAKLDETKGVEFWAPRLYSAGLASVGEKSTGVRIIGIDPTHETRMTRFDKKIIQGRNFTPQPSHEAILGKGLAEILKAEVQDEIIIVSQGADGSIANDLYTIVGIVSSGDDLGDRAAFYLHLGDAQELLVLGGRIHEIALTVDKLSRVRQTARLISEKLDDPELSVVPWQVFAKAFYDAMQVDREGMWIELLIIMLIVAVGVLNTVLMSVLERQREYGVLKAIGTKPGQIVKLVLFEVAILALISIIAGSALSLGANSYLAAHGIKMSAFSKSIENFTYGGMKWDVLRSEVNAQSFLIPAVTVLLSALTVSLFPAFKAARTEPARTMRIQ